MTRESEKVSVGSMGSTHVNPISEQKKDASGGALSSLGALSNPTGEASEFKAMVVDASVFTIGDEED